MFAKLSIRAKITSLVAVLLVSLAALGGLSLLKMNGLHVNTSDIADNWLPSVRVLGELRSNVLGYRNNVREHLLGENSEQKRATEAKLSDPR